MYGRQPRNFQTRKKQAALKHSKVSKAACIYYGTPDRIRICDLLSRSQALYPTELRAHINCLHRIRDCYQYSTILKNCKTVFNFSGLSLLQLKWNCHRMLSLPYENLRHCQRPREQCGPEVLGSARPVLRPGAG